MHPAQLCCRSDYEVVNAQGIQVISSWDDFHFAPNRVICAPEDYEGFPDYILE